MTNIDEALSPLQGDFSLKLNFEGVLTLEVIQDALKGSQLLLNHTQAVLRELLEEDVTLSRVQVRRIEAGSFVGDLSAVLDSTGRLLEKVKGMSVSQLLIVGVTACMLAGVGSYTLLNLPGGSTSVGDVQSGIVGEDNDGNTINHYVVNGPSAAEISAELKRQFPNMDELCEKVAEAVVKRQQQTSAGEDFKRASVYLSHPGKLDVSSIVLANSPADGADEVPVQAVIGSDVTRQVPREYKREAPREDKVYQKDVGIQIRRMNVDSCPEGVWYAKVNDPESVLPDRSLRLIVDDTAKADAIRQRMGKECIRVNMWAVFKRGKNGNPQFLRYILDQVLD